MALKEIIIRLKYLLRRIELIPFLFVPNSQDDDIVIVTAADSTHYKSLCQFLSSLFFHESDIRAVVFNLGLTESQVNHLKSAFPTADLRYFDFLKYPDYFDIKVNAGEYAWKPVILHDVLNEFKGCVCWMDAGNLIIKPLFWLRRITHRIGMYSPHSSGLIADWTHPKTLEHLNAANCLLKKPNLSGNCIAVDYHNRRARELVERWRSCALTKDCIAPAGSSRANHRQDQAVLSVIAHQVNITKGMPIRLYGFKVHQDID
jgi:Protein of unknown function (DUF1647)